MIRINHKRAQAATELAVFGAILIFLLGAIIRSAVGNSYTQNQNLKSMRMAMLESWNGSKAGNISHNSASVLFVEDRLSPDIGKYGDLDRNPYIANGSGTFSFELMYPLDPNEAGQNLPIMDVYINGQHFPFTTASYVQNRAISPPGTNGVAACGTDGPYEISPSTPSLTPAQCLQNQCLRNQREWVYGANGQPLYKLFYTRVANGTSQFVTTPWNCPDPNTIECKDKALNSSQSLGGVSNAQGDLMYDLQRNGDKIQIGKQLPVEAPDNPITMRHYVAWQWAATAGTVEGKDASASDGVDPMIGLDTANNQYPSYDIDGRLKEVTIYGYQQTNGVITNVTYQDPDGGDIDGAWDINSCGPKPGLQSDQQIYTFTQDGTFLQIKEGKLYNPETGQAVRSTSIRNTIDLIQRKIQLSNNTYRFCDQGGNRLSTVANDGVTPNPVEACGNCFDGDNLKKTCFDSGNNMIYVRSRLQDRRGNSWMTNASGQLKVQ